MNNYEISNRMHEFAMELADLADIAKIRGKQDLYKKNLEQAYVLEREAAMRLRDAPNDFEWKYLYLKSAGWLAYQLGKYHEALVLVDLGLKSNPTGIALHQLQELQQTLQQQLSKKEDTAYKNKNLVGFLASADVEQEQIKVKGSNEKYLTIKTTKERIQNIVRYLIGEKVNIDLTRHENGILTLNHIQKAVTEVI